MLFQNTILNLIFWGKCFSCGKEGVDFCLACLIDSPATKTGDLEKIPEWIFPLFNYQAPGVKKAIRLLKYKNRKNLVFTFAQNLKVRILEELTEQEVFNNFKDPILIPIPLSRKRFLKRGFNQSELLCRALEKSSFGKLKTEKNILRKIKETNQQAKIKNKTARRQNLIGAFGIKNKEKVKNKNIILIDDVTTTGATLTEAKKVLENAGARQVLAFTLAH